MKTTLTAALAPAAVAFVLSIPAHAASDGDFLRQAMEMNLSELAMGQLAQRSGASEAVRDYGSQLVVDHLASGGRVIELARAAGLDLPAMPGGAHMAVTDELVGLNGADFDRAFAQRMIARHQEAIALFEDKASEEGTVADYAASTLPILQGHLQIAELLSDKREENAGNVDGTAASDTTAARQEVRRPVLPDGSTVAPGGDAEVGDQVAFEAITPTTIGADAVIGIPVYSIDNKYVGAVSQVVLSTEGAGGTIDAVVIDVGGFLGIGEKPVAVGFDTLEIRTDRDGLVYAYSRHSEAAFEHAPEYDPDTYQKNRDTMRVGTTE